MNSFASAFGLIDNGESLKSFDHLPVMQTKAKIETLQLYINTLANIYTPEETKNGRGI
jgi:hypothetical protein